MGKKCSCDCSQNEKDINKSKDEYQTDSKLEWKDTLGHFKVRWGFERNNFQVSPGLYRLGTPDETSPVFVTANYKFSFDELRSHLQNLSAWILVLNTKGVNVWCAAGKGSFGTYELCKRIKEAKLSEKVSHRRLILPQLGAPGIKAHAVTLDTGFQVSYGPVYAKDILEFLKLGHKTDEMRRIHFSFKERLVLTPIEIIGGLKTFLSGMLLIPFLVFALTHEFCGAFPYLLWWLGTYLTGTLAFPLLLPLFPWKNFSISGVLLGTLWTACFSFFAKVPWEQAFALGLISSGLCGYLSFNFTGATTFTCPSGVQKEMKWAIPTFITLTSLGFISALFLLVRAVWF